MRRWSRVIADCRDDEKLSVFISHSAIGHSEILTLDAPSWEGSSKFHNDRRFRPTLVCTLCFDICHTCRLAVIEPSIRSLCSFQQLLWDNAACVTGPWDERAYTHSCTKISSGTGHGLLTAYCYCLADWYVCDTLTDRLLYTYRCDDSCTIQWLSRLLMQLN